MVAAFEALMAMSATNTQKVENDFQALLAEKQKQERARRKAQEEKERKEKELEMKLRLKHLEEDKRKQEQLKRQEEARAAKQREMVRREAEMRDSLRYGPKRPRTEYPSSSTARRVRNSSSDDDDGPGGSVLTREEKRKLRLEREMRYGLKQSRRSNQGSGYQRFGKRLPGGAVDIVATGSNGTGANGSQYRSVKERLAAQMPTLTPLNQEKRDTRTIDEFTRDLKAKKEGRVLEGDAAKEFLANGFFSSSKTKAEPKSSRASSVFGSRANSMEKDASTVPKTSGKNTPALSISTTPPAQSKPTSTTSTPAAYPSKTTTATSTKGSSLSVKAIGKLPASSTSAPSKTPAKSLPHKLTSTPSSSKLSSTVVRTSSKSALPSGVSFKKRPRSPSVSLSPPSSRRRPAPKDNLSSEIWALFGKNRDKYVGQDVFSDDEDMEADARILEKEELLSARLARKEDEEALEEERHREEEKRRRKKEKEARERRL